MAANSKIEWTECTWNPVTGCTRVSPGCQHCYAERMAKRLCAMGQPNYRNGFQLTTPSAHAGDLPLHWRQPRMIFVNSMSDLFHQDVPLEFILKVFDVMQRAPQHCFQILTKRSERLAQLSPRLPWPDNVWMGVTVENADYAFRIEAPEADRCGGEVHLLRAALGSLSRRSTSTASTGPSSAASPAPARVPCNLSG